MAESGSGHTGHQGPILGNTAASSHFLQCPFFPTPHVRKKAATTAQQPWFPTKFALWQKPQTQNEKQNPIIYHHLLWGTDFMPSPGMLAPHVQSHHPKAWPSGLEANKEAPRGNQGKDGRGNSRADAELSLQNNLMAAQTNQNWLFPQVNPIPTLRALHLQ